MTGRTIPTTAQAQLIQHFDGGPVPTARVTPRTYQVCREQGWIEKTDKWPFHVTTDAGRAALGPRQRGPVPRLTEPVQVTVNMEKATRDEVDKLCGGRGRSVWISEAVEERLARVKADALLSAILKEA